MFFKKYIIYENKLSEQLSDNNPLKQKLIEMETPTGKHPVYTFLSIGLLIYIWLFLAMIVYQKAYGYKLSIVVVLYTTICAFLTYKKEYLPSYNEKYNKSGFIILIISVILSLIVSSINDIHFSFSIREIVSEFSFLEINDASYLGLSTMSFLTLGVFLSYVSSPYHIYRAFYSVNKTYRQNRSMRYIVKSYPIISFIGIFILFYAINLTFVPAKDDFQQKLKIFVMIYYLYFPRLLAVNHSLTKYARNNLNDIKM